MRSLGSSLCTAAGNPTTNCLSLLGRPFPIAGNLRSGSSERRTRRSFWSNAGAIASILIALAAAGFTGLQWHEAHNQLLLTLKPHVDFDTEDEPDFPPVGIAIINEGPGHALVKSLAYFVDEKPVKDLNEAMTVGKISQDQMHYFQFEPDDVMPVEKRRGW